MKSSTRCATDSNSAALLAFFFTALYIGAERKRRGEGLVVIALPFLIVNWRNLCPDDALFLAKGKRYSNKTGTFNFSVR
jgi:hypothetical protein